MAAEDKTTIKSYFQTGDKPTQAQFENLIDSYQDYNSVLQTISVSAKDYGVGILKEESAASARTYLGVGDVGNFTAITSADTSPGFLGAKITGDSYVTFTVTNPGGDEALNASLSINSATTAAIAVSDRLLFSDSSNSNATRQDQVQGVIDLVGPDFLSKSDSVIASGDKINFFDADDSNAQKTDTVQGILDLAAGRLLAVQTFTSSGTYTRTSGATRANVIVVGGGAAGADATNLGTSTGGRGGGAGGCSIKYITSGLASTETVTVGAAGGTSSFGAHCSATGGSGATGGVGSGGDINMAGQGGSGANVGVAAGGAGGSSYFGGGGAGAVGDANGSPSGNYGGGGGGAADSNSGGGGRTGGAGASGIVVVYEYA